MFSFFALLSYLTIFHSAFFDFERITTLNNSTEMVTGKIYYDPKGRSIVEVKDPINQFMIFEDNNWQIYYPDKNVVYTFSSEGVFQVPIVGVILTSFKEDFGMVKAGFQIDTYQVKGDTIISIWKISELLKGPEIKILQINNKYIRFELLQNDSICIKTTFTDHYRLGNKYFPIEILSEILPGWIGNTERILERIRIKNLKINQPFEERILNFKIPPHVKIKKMESNY